MLQDFLRTLYQHNPPGSYVRWGPVAHPLFVSLEELLESAAGAQTDLFFGPAPRDGTGDNARSGALGAGVVWMDFDDKSRSPRPLLPPSFTVHSGGGYHLYWMLDGFYSPSEVEQLNKTLIEHDDPGEGGRACWDITRVLRVPGSLNSKYTPPRPVKLITQRPDRVYSPTDLVKLQAYDRAVLEIPKGRTRSERDWRLASLLLSWDLPDELVASSLSYNSEKAEQEGEHYVTRTIGQAKESPYVNALRARGRPSSKRAQSQPAANFSVSPLARLVGPEGEERGLQLAVEWPEGRVVCNATQRNFEGRRTINQWLERNDLSSRAWLGSDKTAYIAWATLVKEVPDIEVLRVEQAGRYDLSGGAPSGRVFVYGRDKMISLSEDAPGVSWEPVAHVPLEVRLSPNGTLPTSAVQVILETTLRTYSPEVLLPALGWMAATPLKPVLKELGMKFPILMLFGPKGSGKTSLLQEVLLPLVGVRTEPLAADVSPFALLAHLGQFNALPAWLGEFRPTLNNIDSLQMALRTAYDGHREERGRADQSVAVYKLAAPVVIDGEALFTDGALRERAIAVRLSQETVRSGSPAYQAFEELLQVTYEDRASVAGHYIRFTLGYGVEELRDKASEGRALFGKELAFGRLINTATIVWLGLHVLEAFSLKNGGPVLPAKEEAVMAALTNTYHPGLGVLSAVDNYCEIVAHAYQAHQPWARENCIWDEADGVLWVNVTMTLHWIRRFWRDIPDKELVTPQLEDRREYYIEGPTRKRGGGIYWGINVGKAVALGLDTPRPISEGTIYIGEEL